ncbi:MAG: T9SS type A sorting domain-containing protein [Chitinophagales bacterium]
MKKTFTLFTFILITLFSFGQNQIVNIGFENFDNLGQDEEEPQGWNSFMTAENGGVSSFVFNFAQSQKVERSSDTRPGSSGNYSARIWSNSVVGNVANGNLTTGRIQVGSTTPSDPANHNKTKRAESNHNQSFTGMPDSLAVWVKYNAGGGNEARISATIHGDYDYRDPDGTDANAPNYVVAKAVLNYAPTGGWQRIAIPFDYNYPSNDPQYILISFTTNAIAGGGAANDEVFIDDLEFIYAPNVDITPTTAQNLIENQAGNMLTATENQTTSSREWKFSTSSGGGYQSFSTAETGTTYTPLFATAGTYYIVCESNFSGDIVLSNEVQINVTEFSNNIAPITAQVVFQNQPGNDLTVTENPSADSREWKFSTTSGSGYQSFASAETGTSYTPIFFNTGTYYVVCESTIDGQTAMSNEVEITVNVSSTPSVSITPSGAQNIEINQDGTTLTANETITPSAREWMFSTTSGSGYTSFTTAEIDETYTPNFTTEGTYYLVCFSTMNGTEYMSNEVMITVNNISIAITPEDAQLLYENLPGDTLFAIESQPSTTREWKYSTDGVDFQSFDTPLTEDYFVTLFEESGTYFIMCEAEINGIMKESNVVGLVVNNGPSISISPTASQTISQDEAGTTLNANTGGFTPSSLEWKYSTTSGGSYDAFAVAETNTDYTPLFNSTGEYFVVCEGVFSGQTISSNEVRIEVAEMVSTIEYNAPTFDVYASENQLIVDLMEFDLGNSTIHIMSIDGKMVANNNLNNFNTNHIDITNLSKGIYVFNILTEEKQYQGKFIK